jgi:hypothetical protein
MGAGAVSAPRVTPKPVEVAVSAPVTTGLEAASVGWFILVKRLIAYCLDLAFSAGLCLSWLAWTVLQGRLDPEGFRSVPLLAAAGALLGLVCWLLIAAQEVAFGTSLGKRLLGLRIRGSAGAALGRSLLFLPSLALLGLGVLWALLDRRKRCWHDVASGAELEEVSRL